MFKIIIIIIIIASAASFIGKKSKQAKHYADKKIEQAKEEIDRTTIIKDVAKKTIIYDKD